MACGIIIAKNFAKSVSRNPAVGGAVSDLIYVPVSFLFGLLALRYRSATALDHLYCKFCADTARSIESKDDPIVKKKNGDYNVLLIQAVNKVDLYWPSVEGRMKG